MAPRRSESVYFDWDVYDDGWLDYDRTTIPAMKEFLECFVGRRLWMGTEREVFLCKYDPTCVIKVQKSYGLQNQTEASAWERWKGSPKVARWLAPVVAKSSTGRVIVMKRTLPLVRPPKRLPKFLSDRKVQNYGLLDGKPVCHDYGLGIFLTDPNNIEMEPARWWDGVHGEYYDGKPAS